MESWMVGAFLLALPWRWRRFVRVGVVFVVSAMCGGVRWEARSRVGLEASFRAVRLVVACGGAACLVVVPWW